MAKYSYFAFHSYRQGSFWGFLVFLVFTATNQIKFIARFKTIVTYQFPQDGEMMIAMNTIINLLIYMWRLFLLFFKPCIKVKASIPSSQFSCTAHHVFKTSSICSITLLFILWHYLLTMVLKSYSIIATYFKHTIKR